MLKEMVAPNRIGFFAVASNRGIQAELPNELPAV
jgi:hypothetical protein